MARDLRLQRRPRPRRAHQGPGRAGRSARPQRTAATSSATATASSCSRPQTTRWVGSGRVVYDNKGNPVKAYEPFFDSSPVYDDESDLVEWGVTAITRYDPLSRPIRVDNPNGTLRTVEFDPWHVAALGRERHRARQRLVRSPLGRRPAARSKRDAAAKAAAHAAHARERRPRLARARVFRSVADNGADGQYATLLDLDIDGRPADHDRRARTRGPRPATYDLAGADHPQRERRRGRTLAARRRRRRSRCRPGTAAAPAVRVRLRRAAPAARTCTSRAAAAERAPRRADHLRRDARRRPGTQPARGALPAP